MSGTGEKEIGIHHTEEPETAAAMATNCKRLSFWKTIFFLHFMMAVMLTSTEAKKLRLTRRAKATKLAMVYGNYKKELLSDDRSPKRRRHIGYVNDTPSVKMRVYLFCKTGFLLEIHNSGRITGTANITSENALLEIQIFDKTLRRVKGVASSRYLSINKRGRLTSTFDRNGKNTFFLENDEENAWYSYSSKHYGNNYCSGGVGAGSKNSRGFREKEWFVAIKENGSLRRPCKTHPGMKATHFFVLMPENIRNVRGVGRV